MMTLREFAESRHACSDGLEWLGERDIAAMWAECQRSDWMVWLLDRMGWADAHAQRSFALRCARRVQHLMRDARSVETLEVVERYLRGDATDEELASTWAAADAAADASWADAWAAARAACAAAWAASWAAARAAWAAARAAADAAAADANAAARAAADAAAQADDLRELVPVAVAQALFHAAAQKE